MNATEDRLASLRRATDDLEPTAGFSDRVMAAVRARRTTSWGAMTSIIERRGLAMTSVLGVLTVALLASNVYGLRSIDDLVAQLVMEMPL